MYRAFNLAFNDGDEDLAIVFCDKHSEANSVLDHIRDEYEGVVGIKEILDYVLREGEEYCDACGVEISDQPAMYHRWFTAVLEDGNAALGFCEEHKGNMFVDACIEKRYPVGLLVPMYQPIPDGMFCEHCNKPLGEGADDAN